MNSSNIPEYPALVHQSTWHTVDSVGPEVLPAEWRHWVSLEGSLTAALIAFSTGQFRVNVLAEAWAKPQPREAEKLGMSVEEQALVREVELLCNERVVVYARSIIPPSMFESEPDTFVGLGSKPLGHLLFKDGHARSRQRILSIFERTDEHNIFGRVTPYEYHGGEILVSEYFLSTDLLADTSAPAVSNQ